MNQHKGAIGKNNYLGSCGYAKQCPAFQAVYTYISEANDYISDFPSSGMWKIVSNQGKSGILHYGDSIQLQLVSNKWRLVVCGSSNCNPSAALSIAITNKATSKNVDLWQIVPENKDMNNRDAVKIGDSIKLLNVYSAWKGQTWLVTCGMGVNEAACGNGQVFSVKTCLLNSSDSNNEVSNWVIKRNFKRIVDSINLSDKPYINYNSSNSKFIIDSVEKNITNNNKVDTTNNMETFANYSSGGVVDSNIELTDAQSNTLNDILNPSTTNDVTNIIPGEYDINSEATNYNIQASNLNQRKGKNCSWGWNSSCIPDDINYNANTSLIQNKTIAPLPYSCKSSNLDPNQTIAIKNDKIAKDYGGNNGTVNCNTYCQNSNSEWPPSKGSTCISGKVNGVDDSKWCSTGTGLHKGLQSCKCSSVDNNAKSYIYVDGRKMPIDKNDINNGCYSAKYWMDPSIKSTCGAGDIGKICDTSLKPPVSVSQECLDAIPTISGNKADNTIECASDLRPSQKISIKNTLSQKANQLSNKVRKSSLLYNTKSAIVASKYGELDKSNNILRTHVNNSQSNKLKLDKLDNSIYSQQRQIQIANDETRRRNENLFLLKLLLTYILVIAIPMIVKNTLGESFKNSYLILICIFITIPFIYMLGWNLTSIRNRSPMRWPLRNWAKGTIPDDNDNDNDEDRNTPTCPPPQDKVDKCKKEAEALEEEISTIELQKSRMSKREDKLDNKENSLKKQLCTAKKCIPGQACNEIDFNMAI